VILARAAGWPAEKILLEPPLRMIPRRTADRCRRFIAKRASGIPLAYVTGVKEFWSMPFFVSPSVLIPRPETEHLVESVLSLPRRPGEKILDLGTGSGALAAALAREIPSAEIHAADISLRALKTARMNSARLGLGRIRFYHSNVFSAFRSFRAEFDIIVSNPPYIATGEWTSLPPDVRDHEPRRALLAGPDGLDFIRRLVRQAPRYLKRGGHLVFEFGAGQKDAVSALFGKRWSPVEIGLDLGGLARTALARLR
jgi:release factor glutamine methyltransferase